ncbi:MAG TPA: hypothetical protein PLA74_10770, partial [Syntrophales bacterium]|nr:hypothetical protein [Syntrophales bacterium]
MKKGAGIFIIIISMICIIHPVQADDTEIFVGSTVSVPPNVLILLDTSGSMQEDDKKVPTSVYDPGIDYSTQLTQITGNTPEMNTVYYISKEPNKEWEMSLFKELTTTVDNIGCEDARTSLNTYGYWMGFMYPELDETTGKYECGGNTLMKLYMGNYRNFIASPATTSDYRITIAKDTIESLVGAFQDQTVARIGLMRFDDEKDSGGKVLLPVGSTYSQFFDLLHPADLNKDKLAAKGTTPVAEALAEAGLYFAGLPNWTTYLGGDDTTGIISGGSYISPVQWRCQKNYVILISDGLSYNDNGKVSVNATSIFIDPYINGETIAQYATPGEDLTDEGTDVLDTVYPGEGTHLLDDVAEFLYKEDLLASPATDSAGKSFDDENWSQQNIILYTVGFMTASGTETLSLTDDLLKQASLNGGGSTSEDDDHFYSANSSTELVASLLSIMGKILEVNSSFIAPVVPVNKINKIYSGNSVYLSLFRPIDGTAFWPGNLKKFGLDANGYLLDKNGDPAIDSTGQIKDSASSCWLFSSGDGSTTDSGGAGAVLYNSTNSRLFYTNRGTTNSLTEMSNSFSTINEDVKTQLGVADPEDLI